MDDLQTMRKAGEIAGVDRNTIARWLKAGKLKGKKKTTGNFIATLVSVAEVRKLKEAQPRGRPRMGKVAKEGNLITGRSNARCNER